MLESYEGYKTFKMTDSEMAEFYQNGTIDLNDLVENEYVLIKNEQNEIVDKYRKQNGVLVPLAYKTVHSELLGSVRPKNCEQELAFDMLQNDNIGIKLLTGRFGSGKSMLMIVHALDAVLKGKFDKIVYVRNNIEVANTEKLGALPGTELEKLSPWLMPMADHVGGIDQVYNMINLNQIEVVHLGFMRGRDIRNSIIYCTEAENLTREHVQLLIGRVAQGSQLWLDGDLKQRDRRIFEENNGIIAARKGLAGEPQFACVHLNESVRGSVAALADKLDIN